MSLLSVSNIMRRLNPETRIAMFLNQKNYYSECCMYGPTMYDCRKYSHCLPQNDVCLNFECAPFAPTGVFRNTVGEVLGRGAAKYSWYQNPEYFSFHHMTFYDMHLVLRPCRMPSPDTERKR